jgi:PQQ-dependent catabolism-associated CXXCW motif protein
MRFLLRLSVLLCGLAGLVATTSIAPAEVLEPQTYRLEDYRSPTPATLDDQPGLTTSAAKALWKSPDAAAFIDVLPHAPKPADLAPGTIWREKPRLDIPGSIWLPDTGYGALAPATEAYFQAGLSAVTKDDPERQLVFYCLKSCWMSWNAAKRAKSLGYKNVFWYPGGTDDWAEAGLPLEATRPFPSN